MAGGTEKGEQEKRLVEVVSLAVEECPLGSAHDAEIRREPDVVADKIVALPPVMVESAREFPDPREVRLRKRRRQVKRNRAVRLRGKSRLEMAVGQNVLDDEIGDDERIRRVEPVEIPRSARQPPVNDDILLGEEGRTYEDQNAEYTQKALLHLALLSFRTAGFPAGVSATADTPWPAPE